MAKHKAPTQVSIARTEPETAFSEVVKTYGLPALGGAMVIAGVILFQQWRAQESLKVANAGWEELGRDVQLDGAGIFSQGINDVSTLAMETFAEAHPDSSAGAWAKALELGQHLREDNMEAANRALAELNQGWPDHMLNNQPLFSDLDGEGGTLKLLSDQVKDRQAALKQWMLDNKAIFEPQPMPADAPKVRFNTSAGSFVIGLRSAEAPVHCANFLRLCEEGFYDNMTFHEVEKDKYINSGSAASRDADNSAEWGQDDNGATIKPEIGNLWHFQFAVGASKSIDIPSESSDCRFYIVSGKDVHDRDRGFTVFGAVVEGTEIISAINAASLLGKTPVEPVVIQSTEVL